MPHGLPGDLTRAISLSVARSTTETSSDGPLAANRYFPSGEKAMPHGRLPTGMAFSTSNVLASTTTTVTPLATPTNNPTPSFTGAAGVATGDTPSVTLKIY